VVVTTYDERFSAGVVRIGDLPSWPPDDYVPSVWPETQAVEADAWQADVHLGTGGKVDPRFADALVRELPPGARRIDEPWGLRALFTMPGGSAAERQVEAEEAAERAWDRAVISVGEPPGVSVSGVDLDPLGDVRIPPPVIALLEAIPDHRGHERWIVRFHGESSNRDDDPWMVDYSRCREWAAKRADLVLARRPDTPYVPAGATPP
jgi:hypothetical protein